MQAKTNALKGFIAFPSFVGVVRHFKPILTKFTTHPSSSIHILVIVAFLFLCLPINHFTMFMARTTVFICHVSEINFGQIKVWFEGICNFVSNGNSSAMVQCVISFHINNFTDCVVFTQVFHDFDTFARLYILNHSCILSKQPAPAYFVVEIV